jgi:transposase
MGSLILPHVNGIWMRIFLAEVAARHADKRIVMILDGAGWHKNQSLPLPPNLRLLFLPLYSPELNPVEHLWDDLREKFFHNRVFSSLDALEDQPARALLAYENDPQRVQSITAWDWIINAL